MKELQLMISRRRSVRSYLPDPVEHSLLAEMEAFLATVPPLIPGVLTEMRIIPTKEASFTQKWQNPQSLAFYAEEGDDGLFCAGFRYQLIDLFLQSKGLGTCWVGLGHPNEKLHQPSAGMKLACMMPFGRPDDVPERNGAADFKRKALAEISDVPDERLEPARLAPSAVNSQPWFFVHDGETIHVFRQKVGLIGRIAVGRFNLIDMGIALAHLYVANPEGFRFWREATPPERDGYLYMGSLTL